jgi:AraC-like DNA-binding protein
VEREELQRYLDAGMSLEAIGRQVNRHPTTVAYWLRTHGLQAVHRERHAGRGGIPRETLEHLIGEGLSVTAIAERLGFSETSVKHWLASTGCARHAALVALQAGRRRPPAVRSRSSSALATDSRTSGSRAVARIDA